MNEENLTVIIYESLWIPAPWYRTLYGGGFRSYGDGEGEGHINTFEYAFSGTPPSYQRWAY